MSATQTHVAQFKLHFYKGDSIIESRLNLNHQHLYCTEDNTTHRHSFLSEKEPFLKEMGNYDKETGDLDSSDSFYFYTPKDVFFIEYLHEIGDFDYNDSNEIVKWLDDSFDEVEDDFYLAIANIYSDVKIDIDKHLEKRPNLCKFIFERSVIIHTHAHTTGYEYTEYECNYYYGGIYKLIQPKALTEDEEFKIMTGMTKENHEKMMSEQYDDMNKFFEENK